MKLRAAAVVACLVAVPAFAAPVAQLDVPAGSLGAAVAAIGQQANVSISVADARLWQRRVPPVKGRISVAEALRRVTAGGDVSIVALDARSWRIAASQPARPAPARAVPLRAVPATAPLITDDATILVTASKRDVALDAWQGAVTILGGSDIAFGGERGTDSILARLATVSSTHLGAGRNKLFIRGIADSSFTGPTQATVGQYLGDIRLTYNAPDPDLRLYDVASIEVLEGPQATLYGAGSLGGIIRIVRNPAEPGTLAASVSMGASVTRHGAPGADAGGWVNLPIGDTAALRLVGYGISDGGYIDDTVSGRNNINRTGTAGGRAALRIDAGDDWTVDLGGTFQAIRGDDSQYADRDGPPLTSSGRFPQDFAADYALADVVVAKRWGGLRLMSSTGIAAQQLHENYDATQGGDAERVFAQANHTLLATNETRLWRPMADGFGWIVGGSLLYNRTRLNRALGPRGAPLPVTGVSNSIGEATLYGEVSIEMLTGVTVTGGARFTHARLSGSAEDATPAFTLALTAARAAVTADRTETRLMPSFAVSTTRLPGVIIFARYQQGFRPGGLAIDNEFVRRFRNDRVTTLEAGMRHGHAGRDRFDVALTFAATRWHDIQADYIDPLGLPTTDNIGDGHIYSVSMTGGWQPLQGVRLDAAMTWNDSRVTDPAPRFAAAFAAQRMSQIPNVARFAARAGLDYQAPLTNDLDLRIGVMGQYIGQSRPGIGPILGAPQGNYADTSLTVRVGRPGLGVTMAITNLADGIGNRFALGTPFGDTADAQVTPLRPRTLRLGLDARF